MSDKKISQLSASTTPLAGTEELPIVQSGVTKKVSVANLTNGRSVSVGSLSYTQTLTGGTGIVNLGSGQVYKAADGKVGIGTSSPSKKLTVSNDGAVGLEIDPAGRSGEAATSLLSYNRSTSAFVPAQYDASEHIFYSSTSEVAKIESDGDLVISTGNLILTSSSKGVVFSGGVLWRTGTGSPEGAVTAPVGSIYTNVTGGAGTTLYVKESGSGNTGWVAK